MTEKNLLVGRLNIALDEFIKLLREAQDAGLRVDFNVESVLERQLGRPDRVRYAFQINCYEEIKP